MKKLYLIIALLFSNSILADVDCLKEENLETQVCVTITEVELDCEEGENEGFHNSCDVTLNYDVENFYNVIEEGLDVSIFCNVKLENITEEDSFLDIYSEDLYSSIILYTQPENNNEFIFEFEFEEEIKKPELYSSECFVTSLDFLEENNKELKPK